MGTADRLAEWRTCPRCQARLEHGDGLVSCPSCGFEQYANPAPTASALVVDDDGRVLLARRAGDPGKGLWDLLGGFVDEGEDALATLRRELREEIGLEVAEVGEFLGAIPDVYGENGIATLNLYWSVRLAEGRPEPADDVAALEWVARDDLPPRSEFAFANSIEILERAGGSFRPEPD